MNLFTMGVMLTATNMMSPAFRDAKGDVSELDKEIVQFGQNITAVSTAALGLGKKIFDPLNAAYDDSQFLKAAQGELMTLGIMGEGLGKITAEANKYTAEFAGTAASDFVGAAYAIKSGISTLGDEAVGRFTAIASMTGAATKSTTGLMTDLFASGYGIYRKQFEAFGASTIEGWNALSEEERDIKFGEYFSAGISSTVQQFKTDGTNMSAALSNLGANATSAGVSFAEQLSILGQLQTTMSGSEAATKYRAFLNAAYGAGDKLGLTFTDANDQLLSMPDILNAIKEKYGETLDAVESDELKSAFGTDEAVALVKMLYGETDTLTDSINKMNLSLQEGTLKTRQMAQAANYGKDVQLYDQKVNRLTTSLGNAFAPVMSTVLGIMGDGAVIISDFMNEHETLSSVVIGTVGVLGGLAVGVGSLGVIVGGAATFMPFLSGGLGLVATGMGAVTAATKAATVAMLTNPIALAAVGIAAAAYLIYDNWEPISEFFSNLWGGVMEVAQPVIDYMNTGLSFVGGLFGFGENSTGAAEGIQQEVMAAGVSSGNQAIYDARSSSKQVVHQSNDTIQVTVTNPSSDVDVVRAMKEYERSKRNRQYEDM